VITVLNSLNSYLKRRLSKKVTYLIVHVHAFEACIFKGIHLEDIETDELFCMIVEYTETFGYAAHHIGSGSGWACICCRVLELIRRAKLDHKLESRCNTSREKSEINATRSEVLCT
jgi:hypothetical protein